MNNNNDTVLVEKYKYKTILSANIDAYYINFKVKDNYIGPTDIVGSTGANDFRYSPRFDIIGYPTNGYLMELENKEGINYFGKNKVSITNNYEYDATNYKVKKITTNIAANKDQITEYKYPHSYTGNSVYTTMVDRNMYSPVIEESITIGSTLIFNKKTDYGLFGNIIAPQKILTKSAKQTEESRIQFVDYTSFGKPKYITKDNTDWVVYLWSYKGQYPIAEIKNATYDDVKNALGGQTVVDRIVNADILSTSDSTLVNNLRSNATLKNTLITTYTYKPLVGILTMTDPRGVVTKYDYDNFGRLIKVTQADKVIQTYDYHYKN